MTLIRPRTLILSPYSGNIHRNIQYAKDCLKDSIDRGEAPFASHLLYTQVLDDNIPDERLRGFECEASWLSAAQTIVAYTDLGWSQGMKDTKARWEHERSHPVEARQLGGVWAEVMSNA